MNCLILVNFQNRVCGLLIPVFAIFIIVRLMRFSYDIWGTARIWRMWGVSQTELKKQILSADIISLWVTTFVCQRGGVGDSVDEAGDKYFQVLKNWIFLVLLYDRTRIYFSLNFLLKISIGINFFFSLLTWAINLIYSMLLDLKSLFCLVLFLMEVWWWYRLLKTYIQKQHFKRIS